VTSRGRYCPEHPELIYVSSEAARLVLPHKKYGLDVLVRIGYERDKRQLTWADIRADLPSHIQISERHMGNVYQDYLALMGGANRLDVEALKVAAAQYGGLILTIDGLEPEGGQPQLWVARELLSNTVLAAGWLPRVDEVTLKAFLAPVKALDLPWLGMVSDKQTALVNALQATWDELPHQYCQAHYLGNAIIPVYEADRAMRKNIAKDVRAQIGAPARYIQSKQMIEDDRLVVTGLVINPPAELEEVKIAAQKEPKSEAEPSPTKTVTFKTTDDVLTSFAGTDTVVLAGKRQNNRPTEPTLNQQQQIDKLVEAYAARIRGALSRTGRKPFRLAGLRLYNDLSLIQVSLNNCLLNLPDEPRLTRFAEAIADTLSDFKEEYDTLSEAYSWVLKISDILDKPLPQPTSDDPDKPLSTTVETELDQFLTELDKRNDLNEFLVKFRKKLRNLTKRYKTGLFQCYDIPGLPRTNNDTEALFGRVRRQTKRTSGAYHAKQRLREQAAWLLFALEDDEEQQLQRLKRVSLNEWRNERKRMQEHLADFRDDRVFRKKPDQYLAQLENQAQQIANCR